MKSKQNTQTVNQKNNNSLLQLELIPSYPLSYQKFSDKNKLDKSRFFYIKSRKSRYLKHARVLIPHSKKATWCIINILVKKFGGYDNGFCPSYLKMASWSGYCTKTIKRTMNELKKLGLIEKHNRGLRESNLYYFNWVEKPVTQEKQGDNRCTASVVSASHNARNVPLLMSFNKDSIYHKNFNKKRGFVLEKDFKLSKKNHALLIKLGRRGYLAQQFWIDQFIECRKHVSPKGGGEWNMANANYSFEKFIREEIRKYEKQGNKYILPSKRCAFLREQTKGTYSPTINTLHYRDEMQKERCSKPMQITQPRINRSINRDKSKHFSKPSTGATHEEIIRFAQTAYGSKMLNDAGRYRETLLKHFLTEGLPDMNENDKPIFECSDDEMGEVFKEAGVSHPLYNPKKLFSISHPERMIYEYDNLDDIPQKIEKEPEYSAEMQEYLKKYG